MARLRNVQRWWSKPEAQALVERVAVGHGDVAMSVEPLALFGRTAPLEVELGSGKGEFLIEQALATPHRDFLGVELDAAVARLFALRAARAGCVNLRVLRADGRTVVNLLLPDRSVTVYHVYFPDPWPKLRHLKHRLFSSQFSSGLMRTLAPGGTVCVATDVGGYAGEMFAQLNAAGLRRIDDCTPGGRSTGFARKYLGAGKPVFEACFALSSEVSMEQPARPAAHP